MTDLSRRRLLAAAGAAACAPSLGWADAGGPVFLAAARERDGRYALHGLSAEGASLFALPLPGRGHAAAAHPRRPEAVAFARRPGRFALVIDCAEGRERARLTPPTGRAFCGHGAYSADGALLFTTENAFEAGEGRLGVWDAGAGYRRLGEVPTQGVGPHEVALAPDGASLVVANGGILTHPDSGRAKLNLATMRPNLTRLSAVDGGVIDRVEAAPALRRNSLRHLAVRPDGLVACAAQWEGDRREAPPLLALWRPGESRLTWRGAPAETQSRTRGYAGSIATSANGELAALTAPRGGVALVFSGADFAFERAIDLRDVCGVAASAEGLVFTDGDGGAAALANGILEARRTSNRSWDN
ncbi:MAG: DUF1513 domain-containing protein, partial [Pseudomonadota bacterium]